jgi:hypothetical protein
MEEDMKLAGEMKNETGSSLSPTPFIDIISELP